ncbi:hypothetical protein J7K93_09920 [bacterium]|nr:hypothetical protein [bacterium]
MAFIKNDERKSLSLPGMIDIIFLLLIFSLVTLSTSESGVEAKKRGEHTDKFDLPHVNQAETYEVSTVLKTLLFQIEKDTSGAKYVLALWPNVRDSLTLDQARQIAVNNWIASSQKGVKPKFMVKVPENYLKLSEADFKKTDVCKLISSSIRKYQEENFFEPSLSNRIEIRAVKDTEFRLINYIMSESGKYGKLIPRCVFRTLTEEK